MYFLELCVQTYECTVYTHILTVCSLFTYVHIYVPVFAVPKWYALVGVCVLYPVYSL